MPVANSFTVYADGACAPTTPGPCAWGGWPFDPSGLRSEHSGFIGYGTNQAAEITAAIEGLGRVPAGRAVLLISDSQHVLNGLTTWRFEWERRGFLTAKGRPVANLDLWKRLLVLADTRKVATQWVKGHSGNEPNERADRLASGALRPLSSC